MHRLFKLSSVLRHSNGLRCLGLLLVMLSGHALDAQTSKVNASLVGTVEDATGAPLAAAEVVLRNTDTNQTRVIQTDQLGFFSASELPVGTYEFRVTQPGFAPYSTAVTLTVGQTSRLRIKLVPARLQQQMTVQAAAPTLVSSETAATTTIDHERIEESPVHSRNYLDFVLLSGGITTANSQAISGGPPAIEGSFVFGGLRPQSNNVSIDGLDNNEEFTGSARTELSPEIVREFQVVNNGLSAEFGVGRLDQRGHEVGHERVSRG